jgi:endonuclease/exonuclease/phosphatase family metal-dependent hydrolase
VGSIRSEQDRHVLSAFRLLAVWGPTPPSEEHPVVEFVRRYRAWFEEPVVVAGDFNTSGIEQWRKFRPGGNHYVVLDALEGCRLRSVHHHFWKVEQGKEGHPTFWLYGHADRPFHIDHIFAPDAWPVRSVTVGTFDDWNGYSDHAPMVVEFG